MIDSLLSTIHDCAETVIVTYTKDPFRIALNGALLSYCDFLAVQEAVNSSGLNAEYLDGPMPRFILITA